jgi:hypothetical protein
VREIREVDILIKANELAEEFLKHFAEFDFYFFTGRQTQEMDLRNPTVNLSITLEKLPQGQYQVRVHDQLANENTDKDTVIPTNGNYRTQVLSHLLGKERST